MSGKFSSPVAKFLYQQTLDGVYPDSGHVEAPGGWFAAVTIDDDPSGLDAGQLSELGLTTADVTGFWIVTQDSAGFVDCGEYNSQAELDARYGELDADYTAWAAQ